MSNFGKWIDDGFKVQVRGTTDLPAYMCPCCKKRVVVLPISEQAQANYCPNCGEDMTIKEVADNDDAVAAKTGHWISGDFGDVCSECLNPIDGQYEYLHYAYCPYCGVKMEAPANE